MILKVLPHVLRYYFVINLCYAAAFWNRWWLFALLLYVYLALESMGWHRREANNLMLTMTQAIDELEVEALARKKTP